ncbi:MAG: SMC family ATPase [Acutalibacteraceae bacterium]|nr:SMC family ATPase [Acutalibacteraceae bacterium]
MTPQTIVMQAFGPYIQKTQIDFSPLNDCGLFLITGPTGGGKTAILDAICFALYGKSTGALRSFSQMRNISAPDSLSTLVDYSFTLGKTSYRFCRSQSVYAARKTKERKIKEEHACYKKENGAWTLLQTGSERSVTQYAQEILGLDCGQFSKVMMLPQGEFRKLLLASSQEKAKIFEKLFSTEKWSRVTDALLTSAAELKKTMDSIFITQSSILEREGVQSLQALKEKQKQFAALYDKSAQQAHVFLEKAKITSARLNAAIALQKLQSKAALCENACKSAKEACKTEKNALNDAEKNATQIKPLQNTSERLLAQITTLRTALASAQKLAGYRKKYNTLKEQQKALESAIQNSAKASETALANCRKGEQYIEQLQNEVNGIPALFAKVQTLKEISQAYQRLQELTLQKEKDEDLVKKARADFEESSAQLNLHKAAYSRTDALLKNDLAASLSLSLRENTPCPVCGALHHPNPACGSGKDFSALSKDLEHLEAIVQKAEKLLEQRQTSLLAQEARLHQTQQLYQAQQQLCSGYNIYYKTACDDLAEAQQALLEAQKKEALLPKARQLLQQRKQELEAAQKTLEQSQKALAQNTTEIQSTQSAMETLASYLPQDADDSTAIQQQIQKASMQKEAADKQAAALQDALTNAQRRLDIANTNLHNAQNAFTQAQTDLLEAVQQNPELQDTDPTLYKKEAELAELASQKAQADTGRMKEALHGVNESLSMLSSCSASMQEAENAYAQTSRLAELLRGNNACKTPIKMFVLGMMLDDILLQANEYFSSLSNGRYRLCRITEHTGGNALKGLDIEIFDAFCGSSRSMYTLSGGELFLASLSLAFGLSDVVQSYSGGIRLDSIFIDEGFGTLDRETLDTAMQALEQVQRMGRTIGMISHVTELKNRIGAKIEVLPTKEGSTVKVITPG